MSSYFPFLHASFFHPLVNYNLVGYGSTPNSISHLVNHFERGFLLEIVFDNSLSCNECPTFVLSMVFAPKLQLNYSSTSHSLSVFGYRLELLGIYCSFYHALQLSSFQLGVQGLFHLVMQLFVLSFLSLCGAFEIYRTVWSSSWRIVILTFVMSQQSHLQLGGPMVNEGLLSHLSLILIVVCPSTLFFPTI